MVERNAMDIPNEEYCQCSRYQYGFVVSTCSSDFPHIVYVGRDLPLYLFPQSLYYVENNFSLTKSQKAKASICLNSGEEIEFTANYMNVITDYRRTARQERSIRYSDKVLLKHHGVISPSLPRMCYSPLFGILPSSVDLMNAIPNVVYEIYVAIDAFFTNPPSGGLLPIPHMVFELGKLLKPMPNNLMSDIIFKADWNLKYVHGVCQDLDLSESSEIVLVKFRPKRPKVYLNSVLLYVIDNRRLVWPNKPKYKVVCGLLPSDDAQKSLIEGIAIRADMFYCRFNNFYLMYKFRHESVTRNSPLKTRQSLADGDLGYVEYFAELTYSHFTGFYVCAKLRNCLIEDPKHLLVNFESNNHEKFSVWIRANDDGRVARFRVSSIDQKHFSINELNYELPNISSKGFVVNLATGSVFSRYYSDFRIILMIPDRTNLQVGEFIRFQALYFQMVDAYVIYEWQPMKSEFPLNGIPKDRGFLFRTKLDCTTVKACLNVYESDEFGLVSDSEELIKEKVVAENIDYPSEITVYVEENLDATRSTFFNVYSLNLNPKDVEDDSNCPPTNNWWKSTDPKKCKCGESKELFKELLSDNKIATLIKNCGIKCQ